MKKLFLSLVVLVSISNAKSLPWTDEYRGLFINSCAKGATLSSCQCMEKKVEAIYPDVYTYVNAQHSGELSRKMSSFAPQCAKK